MRAYKTGGRTEDPSRIRLHKLVRVYQFRYLHQHLYSFKAFGVVLTDHIPVVWRDTRPPAPNATAKTNIHR